MRKVKQEQEHKDTVEALRKECEELKDRIQRAKASDFCLGLQREEKPC